jgi:Bacteriophage head to tail connecting protein
MAKRTQPYQKPTSSAPPARRDERAVRMLARYERAKGLRSPWEASFAEAYDYTMPMKESVFAHTPGAKRTDRIFDETGVVALAECASRIQSGLVPPFARWAGLQAGVATEPDQRAEINKALDPIVELIFEILAESNFNQEAPEALTEMLLSLGCLEITEGDALRPIIFKAVPIPKLWVDVGPDDNIDTFYFLNGYRLSQLRVRYPRAQIPAALIDAYDKACQGEEDRIIQVLECVRRDYQHLNEEVYVREVCIPECQALLFEEKYVGQGSCPYIGFRWAKLAGEAWGRGPLMNAMPAIKTVNLTIEMILENAELAIGGIWTAEDDGVINTDTISLVGGTVIPIAPGSGGLKALAPAGNFDVANLVLNDMRANIKKALFNDQLGNPGKTPMSATEVAERQADLARQMGAAFGRLQAEFVQPVLRRIIYILKKKGLIEIPPVNGRDVKIVATSPLAQAQDQVDINGFAQFGGLITQQFGPQMKNVLVDGEAAADWLAEKFRVPKRIVRDAANRQQIIKQLGSMNADPEQVAGDGPTGQAEIQG